MNNIVWFDLIVCAVVIVLGFKGIISGFIKEIFGLFGLIGGVIIASRNAQIVGTIISDHVYVLNDSGKFFFGFLLSLFVFWALCLVIGNMVSKMVKLSGLGVLDKLLGFMFGGLKIFFVLAILFAITSRIEVLNDKVKPYFENSVVYPILLESGNFIIKFDKGSLARQVSDVQDMNVSNLDDNKTATVKD